MRKISYKFSSFINNALKFLFIFVVIGSKYRLTRDFASVKFSKFSVVFFIIIILLGIILNYLMKKKFNTKIIFISILSVGLIIRLIWFYSIDSIPTSDFNRMYICAEDFLKGFTYMFEGTGYMARFPHMSITVLYFSFVQKIFYKNPLIAIRLLNILFSMLNMVILYFIAKEVFKDKKNVIWSLFLAAIYPPMIIYNNAYASENIAMPIFLLSIYLFLKSINKDRKIKLLIGAFFILALANLFRPIAYVVIVAYILYILIYFKEGIKRKVILVSTSIMSFIIPTLLVSYGLIYLNILERPLWKPTEPASISILKGTNFESNGRWNEEDAKVFGECDENYEKADKRAKEIIRERLLGSKKTDILRHYATKYAFQWNTGDFGGICWAEAGLETESNREKYLKIMEKNDGKELIKLSKDGESLVQLIYTIMILITYLALYKKKRNYKLDLMYILFCGFSIQCLITESQDRYTYVVSWIFILLAMNFFESESKVFIRNGEESSER
ncbi:Dolichyl-phosphate-mannose-protein mannosyltransferase [Clostridium cavendishii DSM 21758]|uniref:Dolichyl-phosphate-mannose-protein mannosyltransferase n=1 Tax=Clostridium cavendishii DSM 21758 TaxID=1121302 RepID=A0A1M6UN48_9CLOT|nr:glycosyltransferase family 39 protein [Clostridium cavendishii]SHK70540.1 Dolichyl-phosphate-mannose-protein mannosyltransferase [Clostridium cavendishii DSM 21758]